MAANYNLDSDDKEFPMFVNSAAAKNNRGLELGGTSAMDEGDQKLVMPEWGDPRFGQWDGNMWISFEQPCDDFDLIDYLGKKIQERPWRPRC